MDNNREIPYALDKKGRVGTSLHHCGLQYKEEDKDGNVVFTAELTLPKESSEAQKLLKLAVEKDSLPITIALKEYEKQMKWESKHYNK